MQVEVTEVQAAERRKTFKSKAFPLVSCTDTAGEKGCGLSCYQAGPQQRGAAIPCWEAVVDRHVITVWLGAVWLKWTEPC